MERLQRKFASIHSTLAQQLRTQQSAGEGSYANENRQSVTPHKGRPSSSSEGPLKSARGPRTSGPLH